MKPIDADAVMDIINRPSMMRKSDMRYAIKHLPTIDAVSVVRCKECKYAHMTYDGDCKYCDMWKDDDDRCIELYLDGDFYCADGERRG